MKQLVLVSLVSVALFGALALPASSQTGDDVGTIQVTMSTVVTLSVNLVTQQVGYPALDLSTSNEVRTTWMTSPDLEVKNTSNIPADIWIEGSHATPVGEGATWTLNCDPPDVGVVATNQYVHRFWNRADDVRKTLCPGADKLLAAAAPVWTQDADTVKFRLELNMPTGTTGHGQRNSTVTVTVTAPGTLPD